MWTANLVSVIMTDGIYRCTVDYINGDNAFTEYYNSKVLDKGWLISSINDRISNLNISEAVLADIQNNGLVEVGSDMAQLIKDDSVKLSNEIKVE